MHYDPTKQLMLITDASDFAIGGILLQQPDSSQSALGPKEPLLPIERHWHPIAFYSRKLGGAEIRYDTHDKELLAILESFKEWRHYLEHVQFATRVLSDHNNLRYFLGTKSLSPRQARWSEYLARFDFQIEYRPGSSNPADALSRRPDYARGFKEGEKRTINNALLPSLQNKFRALEERQLDPARSTAMQRDSRAALGPQPFPAASAGTSNAQDILGAQPSTSDSSLTASRQDVDDVPISSISCVTLEDLSEHMRLMNGFREHASLYNSMLPTAYIVAAMQESQALDEDPDSLTTLICASQDRDAEYSKHSETAESIRDGKAPPNTPHWTVDGQGLLRREGRVWVPKSSPLRNALLSRAHDDPTSGHYGIERTREVLSRKYFWPGLPQDVRSYIHDCDVCQRNKVRRHKPYGLLHPLEPPRVAWRHYSMDFVTDLPPSESHSGRTCDAILVVVDRLSKFARYLPTRKTIDATNMANLLHEEVFLVHGPPDSIVSDRGSVFTSQFWSSLCSQMRVQLRYSTAFHPQSDGQTERMNQELEAYLRMFSNYQQTNWASLLRHAEYAYNSKVSASSGHSPISLAFGTEPNSFDGIPDPLSVRGGPVAGSDHEYKSILQRNARAHAADTRAKQEMAREHLIRAQEAQKRWYDKRHLRCDLAVGDEVLLSAKNLPSKRPCKKLAAKFVGPFTITDRIGSHAYRLALSPTMARVHPVFHINLLEKYRRRQGFQPPPVEEIDDGEHYEIEEIAGHRQTADGAQKFFVKWLGWPAEDSTWEPPHHLDNCDEMLAQYWEHPTDLTEGKRRRRVTDRPKSTRKRGRK